MQGYSDMTFPSDTHVALVGIILLGLGLLFAAVFLNDTQAVFACISGVASIATGIIGFLRGGTDPATPNKEKPDNDASS